MEPMSEKKAEKQILLENTKLELKIAWKNVESAYAAAVKKLSKRLKLDGFRAGKVSASVAEKMLSPDAIAEEALQSVLPAVFTEELERSKKQPLGRPAFTIQSVEKGAEWHITAEIAEKPALEIKGYEKIAKKAAAEARKKLADAPKPEGEADEKAQAQAAEREAQEAIYQALLAEYVPAVPELLVRQEVDHDAQELMRQLKTFNFTLAQYLERRKLSEQELSQELAATALGKLQLLFLVDAVAAEQKIEITDAEIDAYISAEVSADIQARFQKDPQYRALIGQTIVRKKVADHLLAL